MILVEIAEVGARRWEHCDGTAESRGQKSTREADVAASEPVITREVDYFMIGSTIGSYRILSELGEGGMGVVYRAQEVLLDREVALKALHPQITRDESRLERFKVRGQSAGAFASSQHRDAVQFLRAKTACYYMVMEFVDGQTLEDVTRQNGALPLRSGARNLQ